MKTKTAMLMVVALLLAAGTFATNVPKMNVHTLNDTKVYVAALTSEQFPSELSLLNSRGDIVYYKKSKAAQHHRSLLNLEHLENGTYTLCLKTGDVSAERCLVVNSGSVCVKNELKEIDPVFSYKNNRVHVTYLNPNKSNVSVTIYKNNMLVLKKELGSTFNIQRSFDVSRVAHGQLDFVLCGNQRYFNYQVSR
ncbi:hypothetical protein [uncultured Draconibacterium sp.]|uniref:hypothetical protein n=1 Tax=uncultured Draconibacterium sp. TaxID=1573823 RepID=UPI003216C0D0